MKLTFPTTVDEFIAYQETAVHKKLTDKERDVTAELTNILNKCYARGLKKDIAYKRELLSIADLGQVQQLKTLIEYAFDSGYQRE